MNGNTTQREDVRDHKCHLGHVPPVAVCAALERVGGRRGSSRIVSVLIGTLDQHTLTQFATTDMIGVRARLTRVDQRVGVAKSPNTHR